MSKRRKRNLENKIRALTKCPYCGQLFNYKLFNQHLEIIHGLKTIKKRRPTTILKKEILDLNEERRIRGTLVESDMPKNKPTQPKIVKSKHIPLKINNLTSKSKNLVTPKPNISQENRVFNLYIKDIKETFKKIVIR